MAEQVIDSLADSISQLTGYVLALQERNEEPPPTLGQNGQQVTMVANVLVKVAHDTAKTFAKFPDIMTKIDEEATKVGGYTADLGNALNAVMTETDRGRAYDSLLSACKAIAQGTCYLLILVYGARVKSILIKAKQVKEAIDAMRKQCGTEPTQELMNETQNVAKEMAELIAIVKQRAQEVKETPEAAATLNGHATALTGARADSVNKLNAWITTPEDAGAKAAVPGHCDLMDSLIDQLLKDVQPPKDMDAMRQMEDAFLDTTAARRANKAEADRLASHVGDAKRAEGQLSNEIKALVQAAVEVGVAGATLMGDIQEKPEAVPRDDVPALHGKEEALAGAERTAVAAEKDPQAKAALQADVAAVQQAARELEVDGAASAARRGDQGLQGKVAATAHRLDEAINNLIKNAQRREEQKQKEERAKAQEALNAALAAAAAGALGSGAGSAADRSIMEAARKLLNDAQKTNIDVEGAPNAVPQDTKNEEKDAADVVKASEAVPAVAALAQAVKDADAKHTLACLGAAEAPGDINAAAAVNGATIILAQSVANLAAALNKQRREAVKAQLSEEAKIAAAVADIEEVPSQKAVLQEAKDIALTAVKLLESANPAQLAELQAQVNKLVAAGKEAAAAESDPALKAKLIAATTTVSNAVADLVSRGNEALAAPADEANVAKVNASAEALAAALDGLVGLSTTKHFDRAKAALETATRDAQAASKRATHHERALLANAQVVCGAGVKLLDATHVGNVDAATVGHWSKELNANVLDFVNAGKALVHGEENPEEKTAVMNLTKKIAGIAANVIKAGVAAVTNPQDHVARANLNKTSEDLAAAVEELVAHADQKRAMEELAAKLANRTETHSAELARTSGGVNAAANTLANPATDGAAAESARVAEVEEAEKLTKALDSLVGAVGDADRRVKLRQARGDVAAKADALENAVKVAAADPGKKSAMNEAANALKKSVQDAMATAATDAVACDLQDASHHAEDAAQGSKSGPIAALLRAADHHAKAGSGMITDSKSAADKLPADVAEVNGTLAELVAAAAAAAGAMAPATKTAVDADVAAIRAATAQAQAAAQALTAKEDDPAANEAVRVAGAALTDAINKLVADVREKKSHTAEVRESGQNAAAAEDALASAIRSGDKAKIEAALNEALGKAREQIAVLENLANVETNPAKKAALQAAAKAIQDAAAKTAADVVALQANPTDPALQAKALEDVAALKAATDKGVAVAAGVAAQKDLQDIAAAAQAVKNANPTLSPAEQTSLDLIANVAAGAGELVGDERADGGKVAGDVDKVNRATVSLVAAQQTVAQMTPAQDEARVAVKDAERTQQKVNDVVSSAQAGSSKPDDRVAQEDVAVKATALVGALQEMLNDTQSRAASATQRKRDGVETDLAALTATAKALAQELTGTDKQVVEGLVAVGTAAGAVVHDVVAAPAKEDADGAAANKAAGDLAKVAGAPAAVAQLEAATKALVPAAKTASADHNNPIAMDDVSKAGQSTAQAMKNVLEGVLGQGRASGVNNVRNAAARANAAKDPHRPRDAAILEAIAAAAAAAAELTEATATNPSKIEEISQKANGALGALANAIKDAENAVNEAPNPAAASAAASALAKMREQAENVAKAVNGSVTAAKQLAMSPGDLNASKDVNKTAAQVANAVNAAVDAANQHRRDVAQQAIRNAGAMAARQDATDSAAMKALSPAIQAFANAAAEVVGQSKNAEKAKKDTAALESATGPLDTAAAAFAAESAAEPKARVTDDTTRIDAATKALVAKTNAAAASPADPALEQESIKAAEDLAKALTDLAAEEAKKRHDNARNNLKNLLGPLGDDFGGVEGLGDLMGLANQLSRALQDLIGNLPNMDKPQCDKSANTLTDILKDILDLGNSASCPAQTKALIQKHAAALSAAVNAEAAATKEFGSNPTPETDAAVLAAGVTLANVLQALAQDAAALLPKQADGPPAGGVEGLAADVAKHAASLVKAGNGQDQIVIDSIEMADLMKQLGQACAPGGERARIIPVARAINDLCKRTSKECKEVGARCRDKKLAGDVKNSADGMINFSVQLKIIAAAKAAAKENDPASENQLMTCCRGVAKCYEQAMDASVVSAIRQ